MKQCSKCAQMKALIDFKTDRRRPGGVASCCKFCSATANVEWRSRNPDVWKSRGARKPYQRDPAKRRENAARWRENNPQKHRDNDRAWRKANPEKARAVKAARLARKRGAPGRHTGEQIKALFVAQNGRCPGCRKSIRCGYHVDHVLPLALGGSNDIGNIQLLCATCNLTKHAKPPERWAQENGRLL